MRWARALIGLERPDEAEDERRRALEAMDRAGFMPDHPWRARLHCLSARIALVRGEEAAVLPAGRACLSALGAADRLPPTYPALAEANVLAGVGLSAMR